MAKSRDNISHDKLKELLRYDPQTGHFTWLVTRSQQVAENIAGSVKGDGYLGIGIDKKYYRAHRLAWFYVHGAWPELLIDHLNGNPLDNRLSNLREANFTENCQNIKTATKRSKSGLLGVRVQQKKGGPSYQAAIIVNGKFVYLGTHPTPEAAHKVYMEAKARLHSAYVPHTDTSN